MLTTSLAVFLFNSSSTSIPLSIIFGLCKTFINCKNTAQNKNNLNVEKFLNEILTLKTISNSSIFANINSILNFNLRGEQSIPLAMNTIKDDVHINEEALIWQYIYEFERAFALITDENRAQHFVTLALFIERKTEQIDEWLFTFQM